MHTYTQSHTCNIHINYKLVCLLQLSEEEMRGTKILKAWWSSMGKWAECGERTITCWGIIVPHCTLEEAGRGCDWGDKGHPADLTMILTPLSTWKELACPSRLPAPTAHSFNQPSLTTAPPTPSLSLYSNSHWSACPSIFPNYFHPQSCTCRICSM